MIEPTKFLGQDPADATYPWKEWQMQAYAVMKLRRMGYVVHGDQNGAAKSRSSAGMAQATGMQKGWPDICVLVPEKPIWVELKRKGGRLSPEQRAIHAHMEACGYAPVIIEADCPAQALDAIVGLLRGKSDNINQL